MEQNGQLNKGYLLKLNRMELLYQFGLSSSRLKDYDFNENHSDRLKELLDLEGAQSIITIAQHYIQNFIPSPIENEDEYWMCSCYPGDHNIPIRFNINWHEVLSIRESDDSNESNPKWELSIFTHKDYLSSEIIEGLKENIPGLEFDVNYRYKKGLPSQLAAIIPIESYFNFISDENVYESIRQYNYQLSCKGRRVHNGHNYELVRLLIQGRFETGLINRYSPVSGQKAYLFAWNSKPEMFDDYEERLKEFDQKGKCLLSWRCNTRSILPGDRIFLIKIGKHPKGIIGSGIALAAPDNGGISIELDTLLRPDEDNLNLAILQEGNLSKQNWTPQLNGIIIKSEVLADLEEKWNAFLAKQGVTPQVSSRPLITEYSQEIYLEGKAIEVVQTRYERNIQARKACIDYHGSFSCQICNFDFEQKYGDIGKEFIHVHHLIQVSTKKEIYEIDPISDLIPVCPNCHAMLHKRNPPFTIEELRELMK